MSSLVQTRTRNAPRTNIPDYFSKYSIVTFREDLPYLTAKQKGNAQDKLLMEICAEIDDVSKLNLEEIIKEIKKI